MRDTADADDALQDALVRALRFFGTFDGRNARGWLLSIVRNVCYRAQARRRMRDADLFDEERHTDVTGEDLETTLLRRDGAEMVAQAVRTLPPSFRELFLLREVHGLSYRELATHIDAPIGTVMSRLARARGAARRAVAARTARRRSAPPIGLARVRDSRGAVSEPASRQRRQQAS
jgi:RNA polymerase sigma-70 factor (ECF subfamily)